MRNNNTILNKRLPAFAGIFVLLLTLITTIILSRNTLLFVTKATVGSNPKNIQITNISTDSFTVSYQTDESVIGTLVYGTTPENTTIALDDRDIQTAKPSEHMLHYITVKNLQPSTKYYFSIASGSQIITNNDAPFEITTAGALTETSPANTIINGTVALADGTFPTEGIITAKGENTQLLSTFIKPDGSYTLSLTQLRANDLQKYVLLGPDEKLAITINTPTQLSNAQIAAKQSNAIPKIVLSQNYDFTVSPDPLTPIATESAKTASDSAQFPQEEIATPVTSPEITTPKADQQFKDAQPLFTGKALPSTDITITINSQKEISAQLQSDNTGKWEFRPPVSLDPGAHTITIESIDANGIVQKISRAFTVNAAGSQFIEPSISPVSPSPTTPPPVTPTRAELPSPTPTPTMSPSPTMVLSPTAAIPSQQGPINPTGSSMIMNSIIGAIIAFGIGSLFFLFTAI